MSSPVYEERIEGIDILIHNIVFALTWTDYISIYLSNNLSIHLSIYLSIYQSRWCLLGVCGFMYLGGLLMITEGKQ